MEKLLRYGIHVLIGCIHVPMVFGAGTDEISVALSNETAVNWRIVTTKNPTTDVVVAGCTVKEFGAKGDGNTDDTAAFQKALDVMGKAGGGTVFAPAAQYAIRGNLHIPVSVTLRGEWMAPKSGKSVDGTVLMAYANRGTINGEPFIALGHSSGVKDLAIWYPEQDANNIAPYPYCIKNATGGDNFTIENVTLVNPYLGIEFGPDFNELFYIHGVYGTPLSTGIQIGNISDIGRVEDVHLNPDIWSESGLPGAPAKNGAHAAWIYQNGTAYRLFRVDWTYAVFLDIRGYSIGMETLSSDTGAANGMLYGCRFVGCRTAVRFINTHEAGFGFTECVLDGEVGIETPISFWTAIYFHSTKIRGTKAAAILNGTSTSTTLFQYCSFDGTVTRSAGNASFIGCSFKGNGDSLVLGQGVNAATIIGSKYSGKKISNLSKSKNISISDEAVPPSNLKTFAYPGMPAHKPAKESLYVVTDDTFGAKKDGKSDDTKAIQSALEAASKNGGGIVFLPGGAYCVRGNLVVPSGVELRGIHDVPHHPMSGGSILELYAGRGEENGTPAVALLEKSGVRGITAFYPDQKFPNITAYPAFLQGRGADIYVINTSAANPYQLADFASFKCDNHYLEFVSGAPQHIGIRVGGGSKNGEIRNAMFNPHYWWRMNYPGSKWDYSKGIWPLLKYTSKNMEAFIFGDCENELCFQNFNFNSNIGLHFISEKGKGANGFFLGHGTDGSVNGLVFDGISKNGVVLVNTECDIVNKETGIDGTCFSTGKQFDAEVALYNTSYWWGSPKSSVVSKSGTIRFELGHFNRYGTHRADGGKIELNNIYLDQNATGDPEFIVENGGAIQTRGCFFGGAPTTTGGALDSRFDVSYDNVIPLPVNTKEISVTLKNPQEKAGMSLMEASVETLNGPTEKDGRAGWMSLKQKEEGLYFMYIVVRSPSFKNGRAPKVSISVDYYDEGEGDFVIRYDSSDAGIKVVPENPGAWKEAAKFQITNSKAWKTFTCEVDDAKFAGRCNGGDLRFEISSGDVQPTIGAVRIRKENY